MARTFDKKIDVDAYQSGIIDRVSKPLSEEELAYFTLNRNETWPVKVADGAESESSTSHNSPGTGLADLPILLGAMVDLMNALNENTLSNHRLIATLIEQGQEEGEMPSTSYLNGRPLR